MSVLDWQMSVCCKFRGNKNLLSLANIIYAPCQMLFCVLKNSVRENLRAYILFMVCKFILLFLKLRPISRKLTKSRQIKRIKTIWSVKSKKGNWRTRWNQNDRDDLRANIKNVIKTDEKGNPERVFFENHKSQLSTLDLDIFSFP